MNKGVSEINCREKVEGRFFLKGDENYTFYVSEWLPKTKDKEKENVFWQLECGYQMLYQQTIKEPRIKIPKHLCGATRYELSARLPGQKDDRAHTVNIFGQCNPLVTFSQWLVKQNGANVEIKNKAGVTKVPLGTNVSLHLKTEGLNGYTLSVEAYAVRSLTDNLLTLTFNRDDIFLGSYQINCIDGEINREIDTYPWSVILKNSGSQKDPEIVYVKVKILNNEGYIKDSLDCELHAVGLGLEKTLIYDLAPANPNNVTILKVGQLDGNPAEFDHCTFKKIEIVDEMVNVGETEKYTIFEDGQCVIDPHAYFIEKVLVYFDFDRYNLKPQAIETINRYVKFLKEMNLDILLEGHTDVRGTEGYNKILAYDRAGAVRDFLLSNGIELHKIRVSGYGEKQTIHTGDRISEEEHAENRRVEISFDVYESNNQAIKYDTISPMKGNDKLEKRFDVYINGFTNKHCFKDGEHVHEAEIILYDDWGEPTRKPLKILQESAYAMKVYSKPVPMDFIMFLTFLGFREGTPYLWEFYLRNFANIYFFELHSCAYFSIKNRKTVLITAYPDTWVAYHGQYNFASDKYFFNDIEVPLVQGAKGIQKMYEDNIQYFLHPILGPALGFGPLGEDLMDLLKESFFEIVDKFGIGVHTYHNIENMVPRDKTHHSETYRTTVEWNIIIFALYIVVIEILLLIITRGRGAVVKLKRAASLGKSLGKKKKWLDLIKESDFLDSGLKITEPKIAEKCGGYYQKMDDGRVAYLYKAGFCAKPLLGLSIFLKLDFQEGMAGKASKSILGENNENSVVEKLMEIMVKVLKCPDVSIEFSLNGEINFDFEVAFNSLTKEVNWTDQKKPSNGGRVEHDLLLVRADRGIAVKLEALVEGKKTDQVKFYPWSDPIEVSLDVKLKVDGSAGVFWGRLFNVMSPNPYYEDYILFSGIKAEVFQKIIYKADDIEIEYDSNPTNEPYTYVSKEIKIAQNRVYLFPPQINKNNP